MARGSGSVMGNHKSDPRILARKTAIPARTPFLRDSSVRHPRGQCALRLPGRVPELLGLPTVPSSIPADVSRRARVPTSASGTRTATSEHRLFGERQHCLRTMAATHAENRPMSNGLVQDCQVPRISHLRYDRTAHSCRAKSWRPPLASRRVLNTVRDRQSLENLADRLAAVGDRDRPARDRRPASPGRCPADDRSSRRCRGCGPACP